MKNVSSAFLVILLSISANAQNSLQHFVDSLANAYLQKRPGALAIGIHDNGKEKIFYYGNNQKPDSSSIFEIGGRFSNNANAAWRVVRQSRCRFWPQKSFTTSPGRWIISSFSPG